MTAEDDDVCRRINEDYDQAEADLRASDDLNITRRVSTLFQLRLSRKVDLHIFGCEPCGMKHDDR